MKTHDLKLSIEFCDAVLSGEKTFEVRKNDRGFQTGDLIRFIPTDGTSYRSSDGTVREHAKHEISGHTYKITYILNGWGIKNGYVVMGIKEIKCNNCVFYHTCYKRNVVCDDYRPRQTEED
ncbi:DUF3850 domain-containing protein [Ruminococcus sp. AF26-25AA]|nr:DUF3850 domain-containing protein [Ruminococcus sp. AF26-25AA]